MQVFGSTGTSSGATSIDTGPDAERKWVCIGD